MSLEPKQEQQAVRTKGLRVGRGKIGTSATRGRVVWRPPGSQGVSASWRSTKPEAGGLPGVMRAWREVGMVVWVVGGRGLPGGCGSPI